MFLCLNNMSLQQYVFMSFCLKNYVLLSEKPVLLSHLIYIYPPHATSFLLIFHRLNRGVKGKK